MPCWLFAPDIPFANRLKLSRQSAWIFSDMRMENACMYLHRIKFKRRMGPWPLYRRRRRRRRRYLLIGGGKQQGNENLLDTIPFNLLNYEHPFPFRNLPHFWHPAGMENYWHARPSWRFNPMHSTPSQLIGRGASPGDLPRLTADGGAVVNQRLLGFGSPSNLRVGFFYKLRRF